MQIKRAASIELRYLQNSRGNLGKILMFFNLFPICRMEIAMLSLAGIVRWCLWTARNRRCFFWAETELCSCYIVSSHSPQRSRESNDKPTMVTRHVSEGSSLHPHWDTKDHPGREGCGLVPPGLSGATLLKWVKVHGACLFQLLGTKQSSN